LNRYPAVTEEQAAMRVVDLGGGNVAFEVEGTADHVGNLDPHDLLASGWSSQAVAIYNRYRDGSDFLRRSMQHQQSHGVSTNDMSLTYLRQNELP
jgi:hypothetical protein